jgi:hypothetical protein
MPAPAACGCTRTCTPPPLQLIPQTAATMNARTVPRAMQETTCSRSRRASECSRSAACIQSDVSQRYSGIGSVSFTPYEERLSDYIVETLVSFARDSVPSWWPVYRFESVAVNHLCSWCMCCVMTRAQCRHRRIAAVGDRRALGRQHHRISLRNLQFLGQARVSGVVARCIYCLYDDASSDFGWFEKTYTQMIASNATRALANINGPNFLFAFTLPRSKTLKHDAMVRVAGCS